MDEIDATGSAARASRVDAFATAAGLTGGAVREWIAEHARIVRRIGGNGDVECHLLPFRCEPAQVCECIFLTDEGREHMLVVLVNGRTHLSFSQAEVVDAVAALELLGLLLEELGLTVRIDV